MNNNFLCHHDLIKNQDISIDEINIILKNSIANIKIVFRMIRFGKLNIDNIIDFINETELKFKFLKSICNDIFPNDNELILNIILKNTKY